MYLLLCRGSLWLFYGTDGCGCVGGLYNTVLCRMEELILCESLGMWGYAYAGSGMCI